jgi:hypothetical protein
MFKKINTKLKQLDLTVLKQYTSYMEFKYAPRPIGINQIIEHIQDFPSSLICLSFNLVDANVGRTNDVPVDGIKLQQSLESMRGLKQFHFYARSPSYSDNQENILSQFQNKYWSDHNWTFGMHRNYFYTLPFHFDYLHEFYKGFDDVKSNNPEILLTNPRLWYNVKYIDLRDPSTYDFHFVKQLKTKMPQLTVIEFRPIEFDEISRTEDLYGNTGEEEKSNITLDIQEEILKIQTNGLLIYYLT